MADEVTLNGNLYSADRRTSGRDLVGADGLGHVRWWIPLMQDALADLLAKKNAAATSETNAAASAATAVNAPGTQATSATSLTLGTGSKTLTIQPGKLLVPNMYVTVGATAGNVMHGKVVSYDTVTGVLVVNVTKADGSGTFSSWTVSVSGPEGASPPGGVQTTTSAVDVTLSMSSKQLQRITMTAEGKAVVLPDATTLPDAGGPVFVLANMGQYTFAVRDAAGGFVGAVEPGANVLLWPSDRTVAAGAWRIPGAAGMFVSPKAAHSGTYSGYVGMTALNSAKAVLCYRNVTAYGQANVLDVSGKAVTPGPETVFNSAATDYIAAVALDASKVLVVYNAGSTGKARVLTISGTSITVGTELQFTSDNAQGIALDKLDASTAVVVWNMPGTGQKACVLSVSGSTVTAGTAVLGYGSNMANNAVVALSASKAVMAGNNNSSDVYCTVLNISGTTITTGATSNVMPITLSRYEMKLAAVDANNVLLFSKAQQYNGSNARVVEVLPLAISGNTITAGTLTKSPDVQSGGLVFSIVKLTSDRYAALVIDSVSYEMFVMPIDRLVDGRVRFERPSLPIKVTASYVAGDLLAGDDLIVAHDTSAVRVMEVKL